MAPPPPDLIPLTELCLPALDAATPLILIRIDQAVLQSDLSHLRDDVQIALAEALNNVSEHGYAKSDPGAVALRVAQQADRLEICLTDWGRSFPNSTMPEGISPAPESLCEGGYGWFLIRALASEIRYLRTDGQNRLCLTFRG